MLLRELTQQYINKYSKNELLKQLKSQQSKQLETFLSYEQIAEFLDKGSYDFSYSSREFVYKLASILEYEDIHKEISSNEREYQKVKSECIRLEKTKINMNFSINHVNWIAGLARQKARVVYFDKQDIAYKSHDETLEFLINVAKTHYQSNPPINPEYGAISSYCIELDGLSIIYDPNNATDNQRGFQIRQADSRPSVYIKVGRNHIRFK